MLQNVLSVLSALDLRRKIIVGAASAAMFLAIIGLARISATPSMALLYAGLDAASAGEVVAALEQQGVAYEVRGDSIHVEAGARDGLRMTLAAEGLPKAGGAGYELLDSLTGFGTTAQMFDAAYWRAKEGEIARTILANPQIRAARVHIARAPDQPFLRQEKPTASITVTTVSGTLPEGQARALRHLVAAAVTGMQPADVQVIDTVGGLVTMPDDPLSGGTAQTRAEAIRHNVERLLAARVGPGKAVVEVALDLVTEREQITERSFDPAGRVAISSETQERSGSSSTPGGEVTVASNLPDGDAGAGASGQSREAETRERVNYEVSETNRQLDKSPGATRRMTVAVLVDGTRVTAADGTESWQPRADEELAALRELIASAAGLDEARGDILTIKSLEFMKIAEDGAEAGGSFLPFVGPLDIMSVIQIAVLGLVTLLLGLFVIRPIFVNGRAARPAPDAPLALPPLDMAFPVLNGEIDDGMGLPPLAMVMDGAEADLPEDPVARLRRLIEERQTESVEILRGWMELQEDRR